MLYPDLVHGEGWTKLPVESCKSTGWHIITTLQLKEFSYHFAQKLSSHNVDWKETSLRKEIDKTVPKIAYKRKWREATYHLAYFKHSAINILATIFRSNVLLHTLDYKLRNRPPVLLGDAQRISSDKGTKTKVCFDHHIASNDVTER